MEKTVDTASGFNWEKTKAFLLNYALYIILGVLIIVVIIIEPSFLNARNFLKILEQASTRGILALGVAGLIVLAGTDLSAGRILGTCAAVSASLLQSITYGSRMYPQFETIETLWIPFLVTLLIGIALAVLIQVFLKSPLGFILPILATTGLGIYYLTQQQTVPVWLPLLFSIFIGVIFGLINGFGVAKLHLHAFIITLGTQLIAYGATCIYIDSQKGGAQPLSSLDKQYTDIVTGRINLGPSIHIPYLVIYFAISAIVLHIIWTRTTIGKNMFAIGGNTEAAEVSGVNISRSILYVYLISGILYGIASYLEAARVGSVTTQTGLNYELDAISGCVIGGVSFSGGVGTIPGVVIGVIILQVINYALYYLGVNAYLQYIIKGLIIILAVSIDVRKYLKRK